MVMMMIEFSEEILFDKKNDLLWHFFQVLLLLFKSVYNTRSLCITDRSYSGKLLRYEELSPYLC